MKQPQTKPQKSNKEETKYNTSVHLSVLKMLELQKQDFLSGLMI